MSPPTAPITTMNDRKAGQSAAPPPNAKSAFLPMSPMLRATSGCFNIHMKNPATTAINAYAANVIQVTLLRRSFKNSVATTLGNLMTLLLSGA